MNEYIEIHFRRDDEPLEVVRQLPNHRVELDEADPIARRVLIGLAPRDDVTRYRTRRIQQLRGWAPGQLKLTMTVERGALVLRGADPLSLPEGRYRLHVGLDEARTKVRRPSLTLDEDGFCEVAVDLETDDRQVAVDLTSCDPAIASILNASTLDGLAAMEWLALPAFRATRKACLLNLLASLRARPTRSAPLLSFVEHIYWVSHDRAYARVHRDLLARLEELAIHPRTPFYREGRPHADIHRNLVESIPPADRPKFAADRLVSFRGEGRPSLQTVVAEPEPGHPSAYAEFDLDLGNPLQDVEGFVVHMGELLDGKATNHLDLRPALVAKKAPTTDFVYYTVAAAAQGASV